MDGPNVESTDQLERQPLGAIDRTVDRAPYRQIADLLRAAISNGQYWDGDRLPSEAELIEHFGVARMTVRAAIQQLRTDGLVRAEHGRGVFVCNPARRPPARPLNRDDLVALAEVFENVIGHSLSPDQSSRLKRAYQLAQSQSRGATLRAVADAAARD